MSTKTNAMMLAQSSKDLEARVKREGASIVDTARANVGRGWGVLGESLQHALVASEIVRRMMIDQDKGSVSIWAWIAREAYKALDESR